MKVVGREGHMDANGNYVSDRVSVEVKDPSGFAAIGSAATEEEAEAAAIEAIEGAKKELAEQQAARREFEERVARLEALEARLGGQQ